MQLLITILIVTILFFVCVNATISTEIKRVKIEGDNGRYPSYLVNTFLMASNYLIGLLESGFGDTIVYAINTDGDMSVTDKFAPSNCTTAALYDFGSDGVLIYCINPATNNGDSVLGTSVFYMLAIDINSGKIVVLSSHTEDFVLAPIGFDVDTATTDFPVLTVIGYPTNSTQFIYSLRIGDASNVKLTQEAPLAIPDSHYILQGVSYWSRGALALVAQSKFEYELLGIDSDGNLTAKQQYPTAGTLIPIDGFNGLFMDVNLQFQAIDLQTLNFTGSPVTFNGHSQIYLNNAFNPNVWTSNLLYESYNGTVFLNQLALQDNNPTQLISSIPIDDSTEAQNLAAIFAVVDKDIYAWVSQSSDDSWWVAKFTWTSDSTSASHSGATTSST